MCGHACVWRTGTAPRPPNPACTPLPACLQSVQALRVGHNRALSGPAFPPAWLRPGALQHLEDFRAQFTPLAGTLPANLSWPRITSM